MPEESSFLLDHLYCSLFNILVTVWGVLIAKYCSTDVSHIHYPIAIKEGRALIYGAQINTLILPVRFSNGKRGS